MKVKTNELSGAALDWAVAKCEGLDYWQPEIGPSQPEYSSNWAQGGPIIEREGITIFQTGRDWMGYIRHDTESFAPTPLIAAMRCYVASKLGDEVEIPEGLK